MKGILYVLKDISKRRLIEETLQHTNCIALAPFLIPGGSFMLWLYIPGGSTGVREIFESELTFPRLEEQRLRLRDLSMVAELLQILLQ